MFLIELDLLIAFSSKADRLHTSAGIILEAVENNTIQNVRVATSALLEYSLVLKSKKVKEIDVQETLIAWQNYPNLGSLPISPITLIEAAKLRSDYQVSFFDSLHAATAIVYAAVIISTDAVYSKIRRLNHSTFDDMVQKLEDNF